MKHIIIALACLMGSCRPTIAIAGYTGLYQEKGISDKKWVHLGEFKATAYCSCIKCCGKSDGITASGRKANVGTVACNWLPFGTKLKVARIASNSSEMAFKHALPMVVLDRGAKSLFGSKHKHIKHIDLWMNSHKEALQYGVRKVNLWALM